MNTTQSILVVDADESQSQIIDGYLLLDGHSVTLTASADEAEALKSEGPFDLLIIDQGELDTETLAHLHDCFPLAAIITLCDHQFYTHPIPSHLNARILVKPVTQRSLKEVVVNAGKSHAAVQSGAGSVSQPNIDDSVSQDLGLIGESNYIKELRAKIRQVAPGTFPLLIEGPSGTGKEVIANAIHRYGPRNALPLITINCAAIPENLEESEFFGYAKGAFTGANWMKHGIVASADKSTLFLDEIAELSLEVQAKLLRVLDTGEYIRIGENTPRTVDIRIVSATNMNLEEMVSRGAFRHDLLFRLKGAYIQTQPLAQYGEDVPRLVNHFLNQQKDPRIPRHITKDAMQILNGYHWPGNIRELKHTVAYFCTASIGLKEINRETVQSVMQIKGGLEHSAVNTPYFEAKEKIVAEFDNRYFCDLLKKHAGNLNQASKAAGMYRTYLIKKLKEINIDPDLYRGTKTA